MTTRPKTQREIEASLRKKTKDVMVIIENIGNQNIKIQLRAPEGADFLIGEQTVALSKKSSAQFPQSRLYNDQIKNLQKSGMIRVRNIA